MYNYINRHRHDLSHLNVFSYDPTKFLENLAELLEKETNVYMASDPDPFEERHPCRVDPDCQVMIG